MEHYTPCICEKQVKKGAFCKKINFSLLIIAKMSNNE
jgi:hypothetical protein